MVRRLFAGGSGDSNSRSLLGLGPLRAGTAARNQYGEPRRAVPFTAGLAFRKCVDDATRQL